MTSRHTVFAISATPVLLALGACATDVSIYQPPTEEPTSVVTFVNSTENQRGTFTTFEDATACTGRQYIRFDNDDAIPAG